MRQGGDCVVTNRQWLIWNLIDMSDKELVKAIGCEICNKYITPYRPSCSRDCGSLLLDWLKQEHEEREE